MEKPDLISAWFPSYFLQLLTIVLHVENEFSKKTVLCTDLSFKFLELAELILKMRYMFVCLRGSMSQKTQSALTRQFAQLEVRAKQVCMCCLRASEYKSTSRLEEKMSRLVHFCKNQSEALENISSN
jgi:hypothetical protein